jgi:acryloyl-coenzyme A reductase
MSSAVAARSSERMRATVLHAFGDPWNLEPAEVERPSPGPGEVLVRVRACGVCGHDLLARAGRLGGELPRILGHEIAGEVAELGAEVDFARHGERVVLNQRRSCGACRSCSRGRTNLCVRGAGFYGDGPPGGYGEYVLADESNLVALPDAIEFAQAATLPCGVGTGIHALGRLRVSLGERVAVVGAGGGVGLHAVALTRLAGAHVVGVTHSPSKADAIEAAGADVVVVNPAEGMAAAVREQLGDGDGVDAVIDCVGAPTFAESLRMLRHGGRLAAVGNVDPRSVSLHLGLVLMKELELLGSAHATPAELRSAVELVACGRLQPALASELPFGEARRAHELLEAGAVAGRIVLTA